MAVAERPLAPRWNFHKFSVGGDGHIAAVFSSDIEPSDARIVAAVQGATAASKLICVY